MSLNLQVRACGKMIVGGYRYQLETIVESLNSFLHHKTAMKTLKIEYQVIQSLQSHSHGQ